MFQRHVYKTLASINDLPDDAVGMVKMDGGNYFMTIDAEGNVRYVSRRPSVKGGFPDKTDRVPHLAGVKLPQFAGHTYNVELIHTGLNPRATESHSVVSGILNSLPERAQETQKIVGPVRAVIHNVINPEFSTFKEKYEHMKKVEEAFGNKDLFFVPELYPKKDIPALIDRTKRERREGVIVTSLSTPEHINPRLKHKHKVHFNLKVTKIVQLIDIKGNPQPMMGAVEVADATGTVVGLVGTGFSKKDREDAWNNPDKWIGELIQVESRGIAARRLREPVYNGFADGDIDRIT